MCWPCRSFLEQHSHGVARPWLPNLWPWDAAGVACGITSSPCEIIKAKSQRRPITSADTTATDPGESTTMLNDKKHPWRHRSLHLLLPCPTIRSLCHQFAAGLCFYLHVLLGKTSSSPSASPPISFSPQPTNNHNHAHHFRHTTMPWHTINSHARLCHTFQTNARPFLCTPRRNSLLRRGIVHIQ